MLELLSLSTCHCFGGLVAKTFLQGQVPGSAQKYAPRPNFLCILHPLHSPGGKSGCFGPCLAVPADPEDAWVPPDPRPRPPRPRLPRPRPPRVFLTAFTSGIGYGNAGWVSLSAFAPDLEDVGGADGVVTEATDAADE